MLMGTFPYLSVGSSEYSFSILLSEKEALLLASKPTLKMLELKAGASFFHSSDGIIQNPCDLHYFHAHIVAGYTSLITCHITHTSGI